jgi:hypothetical protein
MIDNERNLSSHYVRGRNPFECLAELWKPKVGPENLRKPKKGFLLQHDELFKFKESYKMEGTWKCVHSISCNSWNLRPKCKTLCKIDCKIDLVED